MIRFAFPVALAVVSSIAVAGGAQQARPALPEVISLDSPMNVRALDQGRRPAVQLRVRTDGTQVIGVESRNDGNPLLAPAAIANVRTWRFAPHVPTEFDTEFRIVRREVDQPCLNPETNSHLTASFPSLVEVAEAWGTICDPSIAMTSEIWIVSRVVGSVRCDCRDRHLVAGAEVSLVAADYSQRTIMTGSDGAFRFTSVVAGSYYVDVFHREYRNQRFKIRVIPDEPGPDVLNLRIEPNIEVTEALKKIRPTPTVTAATVPFYPSIARADGVEGVVTVAVSAARSVVRVSGPVELTESAKSYVQSWTYRYGPETPFDVIFTYKLLPADCVGGGPVIAVRFPFAVDVTAKRVGSCGPRPLLERQR